MEQKEVFYMYLLHEWLKEGNDTLYNLQALFIVILSLITATQSLVAPW